MDLVNKIISSALLKGGAAFTAYVAVAWTVTWALGKFVGRAARNISIGGFVLVFIIIVLAIAHDLRKP